MWAKKEKRPCIIMTETGPYLVTGLKRLVGPGGERLQVKAVTSLCRCGASKDKPYCDGSHVDLGFECKKFPERTRDRTKRYAGENITILDNRGVCSHNRACVKGLPEVFRKDQRPWIDPDGAPVPKIIEIIEKCPSGALSYELGGHHLGNLDRDPAIQVDPHGPLEVVGDIEIRDNAGTTPQMSEHYTLCRCGETKNCPFCDGSHFDVFGDPDAQPDEPDSP